MHTGSILSDTAIRNAVECGAINIDPFTETQLNITSYDLTLGDEVRVYKHWVTQTSEHSHVSSENWFTPHPQALDVRDEPETVAYKIDPKRGWVLNPGIGYLMCTRERVGSVKYNAVLDGKSSVGRLFLQVHSTAGYIDPGFFGQITLEVIAQHPVRVYAGMRIAQVRFHTISGDLGKTYDQVGHYVGEHSKGAVASQAWRQFKSTKS